MHVIASMQSSKALAYALPLHLPRIRTLGGLSIGFPCKIDPGLQSGLGDKFSSQE
jgi:hypothetical protein